MTQDQGKYLTVRGANLNEALENARKLAGGKPRVVGTRHVEANSFLGLVKKAWVELLVDVSEDRSAAGQGPRRDSVPDVSRPQNELVPAPALGVQKAALQATAKEFLDLHAATLKPAPVAAGPAAAAAAYAKSDGALDALAIKHLSRKVDGLMKALDSFPRAGEDGRLKLLPQPLQQEFECLVALEVPRELARELVLELGQKLGKDAARPGVAREELLRSVASRIPFQGPIAANPDGRRVVALVGPTGAGKTTTISKLAARFRFEGRKVGVVTLDTYRLAAAEQLRVASNRARVPLAVARNPRELRAVLEGFREADLVLVDTAGRNARDAAAVRREASLLAVARPDEVHLVLPATGQAGFIKDALERYQQFAPTHTVLSKVDEAASLGGLLGVLSESKAGLSYLTVGQEIPDDIEEALPERFARRLLGAGTMDLREAV